MQIQTDGVMPEFPDAQEEFTSLSEAGIAVDVGTTTVAVSLWTLADRKCLATVAEKNVQVRYGHDVIKRISFAVRPPLTGSAQIVESGPSALHYGIINQLEKLYTQVIAKATLKAGRGVRLNVSRIVITGNTTMLSFVCAMPVDGLAAAPFNPASRFGFTTEWGSVREGTVSSKCEALDPPTPEAVETYRKSAVKPSTPVYFPPCIGAFIGADMVCAMLSAGFSVPGISQDSPQAWEAPVKAPLLLADIGTNTEIALYIPESEGQSGKILCTSAAAGPAFECANISCGMSSVDGAIDRIDYKGSLDCHVIGEGNAKGICGSGLISTVATLFRHKYIDNAGVIQKNISKLGDGSICIQLTPAVFISQQDIRNMQLAKSAVYTGLSYMLERSPSLPVFCVAGGFGSHINIADACEIGLIPKELENRCVHLGNAALAGASALLFSRALRQKAVDLVKHAFQINLAAVPDFQHRYLRSIEF